MSICRSCSGTDVGRGLLSICTMFVGESIDNWNSYSLLHSVPMSSWGQALGYLLLYCNSAQSQTSIQEFLGCGNNSAVFVPMFFLFLPNNVCTHMHVYVLSRHLGRLQLNVPTENLKFHAYFIRGNSSWIPDSSKKWFLTCLCYTYTCGHIPWDFVKNYQV